MQELINDKGHKQSIQGVVIGVLVGFSEDGAPLVVYGENPTEVPVSAQSTVLLEHQHLGKKLALLFSSGDPLKPVIIGPLLEPEQLKLKQALKQQEPGREHKPVELVLDGKRLVLTAENELVLKCGEASVTLKKNGKILVSGTNLLSRARFANRIKGGSVQIN
ncbi:hypothetical protein SG34_013420 [Thalassomonas viridans]|uniref:DUF6484 domain-containing protein n=1 Tax=Thalassomonas viridans TaxID=137584 RepID=A0AAE9Z745_9GAMM|nr:DUF6484 domain-containing protein [Thalassomonas viridans]WDE07788.1 hypothetical protein SG34_013420 [Thalassomonas viridans]